MTKTLISIPIITIIIFVYSYIGILNDILLYSTQYLPQCVSDYIYIQVTYHGDGVWVSMC